MNAMSLESARFGQFLACWVTKAKPRQIPEPLGHVPPRSIVNAGVDLHGHPMTHLQATPAHLLSGPSPAGVFLAALTPKL